MAIGFWVHSVVICSAGYHVTGWVGSAHGSMFIWGNSSHSMTSWLVQKTNWWWRARDRKCLQPTSHAILGSPSLAINECARWEWFAKESLRVFAGVVVDLTCHDDKELERTCLGKGVKQAIFLSFSRCCVYSSLFVLTFAQRAHKNGHPVD